MISAAAVDRITKWVVVGPWLLWAAWELALVALRHFGVHAQFISQMAKGLAYRGLASLAYFWAGMGAHYFLNWRRPVWSSAAPGVAFWAIGLAYLAADLLDGGDHAAWPVAAQWLRWPPLVAVLGLLAGWLLFPQGENWEPPGGPP